jgi:hypothetical protein
LANDPAFGAIRKEGAKPDLAMVDGAKKKRRPMERNAVKNDLKQWSI